MELYYHTRTSAHGIPASRAVIDGMGEDGGLFVLRSLPVVDAREICLLPAREISARVMGALLPDYSPEAMQNIVARAYEGRFETGDLTPLVQVGERYVLELYRGPTAAFKDVALCALPQLIAAAKAMHRDESETMILTATSGDTGKAALSGFCDMPGMKIAVFYPEGGVSAIQRAQMVTQPGANIAVCAIRGNFDDAQACVKRAFERAAGEPGALPLRTKLSSANSINIGRLAPQAMYYFKAYGDLMKSGAVRFGEPVDFVVPTGNFGDILAGYLALHMGLPVGRLVCASNRNDVLTDFIRTGIYDRRRPFYQTASPSMDILVSSNLERLLYYECGGDFAYVRTLMRRLGESGRYEIGADMLYRIRQSFLAHASDDEASFAAIRQVYERYGYLMDTHTAVAWNAAAAVGEGRPTVVLSTASPYKFADDVLRALTGECVADGFLAMERLSLLSGVPVPSCLARLRGAEELHLDVIDAREVFAYIQRKAAEL